jgi:peptide/nickel transport system ATP-binding protein
MKPKVLIADESVAALDVSVQAQVLQLLTELQTKLGLTIVFITHDLRVAAAISDQIAVMQNGEIVECGPTPALLSDPVHPYTKALLASAPRFSSTPSPPAPPAP